MRKLYTLVFLPTCLTLSIAINTHADADADAELAKKLANPVAALISVPIQVNYDKNIGPGEDGSVWRTNVQPVIPFSMDENWNLISRTIVPIIDQQDVPINGQGKSGLGDILQSVFFSPKEATASGIIWGVGPALLLDSASSSQLGAQQWAAGPTGVMLKQQGPWTFGMLANHLESFAGENNRDDISASFIQPFLTYITATKTTYVINTESIYDWEAEGWSVPINVTVNQLFNFSGNLVQLGGGVRYWAESTDNGPDDWGARLQVTLLFPK